MYVYVCIYVYKQGIGTMSGLCETAPGLRKGQLQAAGHADASETGLRLRF